ncbi:MAG: glycosyltransferase family protein [Polyangiaceae bacterium]|jgi:uncharacterized protein (TIGR00661 family)
MRIVYGIFGYGRGHATRAEAVLSEIRQRHDVLILVGGDAHEALCSRFPVERIPSLGYVYGARGERSVRLTFQRNFRKVADLVFGGETFRNVVRRVRDFKPDVAICDADPWTHRAAAALGVPRIGFDHFGIMAWCRPPIAWRDTVQVFRDVFAYRALNGRPQRVVVSSFFDPESPGPGVRVVGPLLRDEVRRATARPGDHVLVYFNQSEHQLTPRVMEELRALRLPVVIYGKRHRGTDANLVYKRVGDPAFLDDLASCRAVLSTAGNQLVGETMHLGKPILVAPENTPEQRMNALAVERLGVGARIDRSSFTAGAIRRFLAEERRFAERARTLRRDGREASIAALETFARELGGARQRAPLGAWRPA